MPNPEPPRSAGTGADRSLALFSAARLSRGKRLLPSTSAAWRAATSVAILRMAASCALKCASWPEVMRASLLSVGGRAQRRQPGVGPADDAPQRLLQELRLGEAEAQLGVGFGGFRRRHQLDDDASTLLGERDARVRIIAAVQLCKARRRKSRHQLVGNAAAGAPQNLVELGHRAVIAHAQDAEYE